MDVLAIGAHPDDVELSCGGTMAKLVQEGLSAGILDLTRGEMGTRGTPERRAQEAAEAASILGIRERRTLDIPDGNIEVSEENVAKVVRAIRDFQPRMLLIPHSEDRHPDHVNAHRLCKQAWFSAGLKNFPLPAGEDVPAPHRPDVYFEFMQWFEFTPSFIVDISDTYALKAKAIRAFRSQFHDPKSTEPQTKLSTPEFFELLDVRARAYGEKIGVRQGEPFFSISPIGIQSLQHISTVKG